MYLLIEVAGYIDAWPTIGLVMLTAVIGVALLKRQGMATLTRGVSRLESGQLPATEMAEGLLLAVAGALLVTPGFVTDTVGFTLLFPPTRKAIAAQMLKRVQVHSLGEGMRSGMQGGVQGDMRRESSNSNHKDGPVVIEGDFERRS